MALGPIDIQQRIIAPSLLEPELEAAYREHAGALERHALALTRDRAVAEDVVQEAFVRLATELRQDRRPDNVRAWLHRVAANVVTSRGRRMAVAERHLPGLVDHGDAESPECAVLDAETSAELRAALATLPETDRRAVVLAAEGYRGHEIAALIGRSEGATRTLLCRARSRLRTTLLAGAAA
jgi:RNA polymerase sigma-70 factor (ECF subfamily)